MLDLLSSLKEPKTKTLKLCDQSKTAGGPGGRAGGQLVRGVEPSPPGKPGGLGSFTTNCEVSV